MRYATYLRMAEQRERIRELTQERDRLRGVVAECRDVFDRKTEGDVVLAVDVKMRDLCRDTLGTVVTQPDRS